jgi:hypothetical protein
VEEEEEEEELDITLTMVSVEEVVEVGMEPQERMEHLGVVEATMAPPQPILTPVGMEGMGVYQPMAMEEEVVEVDQSRSPMIFPK